MDLLVRELDQLREYCGETVPQPGCRMDMLSVFELTGFFRKHCLDGNRPAVVEGVGWLAVHARSALLRAQIDAVLDVVLPVLDPEEIWQLACLFATGNRSQAQWFWNHLVDEPRVLRCLEHIADVHPLAAQYLDFYRQSQSPQQMDPARYQVMSLVIEAVRIAAPYRTAMVLRLLERLVRCGSLAAWELLQQMSLRQGQGAVVDRWLEAMRSDPFPFAVNGTLMKNRTQLLRWAFLCSPEQLAQLYDQLNRRQWFAMLNLLDPQTRYRVSECTWRRYGRQLRL